MPPFVEGAYQYADLVMQWGAKYGIGVWLGVHAVNGSQNGYEASAPEIARTELWDATPYPNPTYYNQSLTFVTQLMQRYGSSPALVAVSLMNEPTVSGFPETGRRPADALMSSSTSTLRHFACRTAHASAHILRLRWRQRTLTTDCIGPEAPVLDRPWRALRVGSLQNDPYLTARR
jgi:hypothetical protein